LTPKILVLGGTGFIGRHAVAALNAEGANVLVGSRTPSTSTESSTQRLFRLEEMTQSDDWQEVVREFDVILNCVGILRPSRSSTYERIHYLAPKAIARACSDVEARFVHVSALGLSPKDQSGFVTTKLKGENAIKATNSNWIISRPSLLDGEGGYGATWLRGVSRLPVFVVPADAKGTIAALTVTDLGEALAKLCLSSSQELRLEEFRIFELGGNQLYNFEAYIRGLRLRHSPTRALAIPIPGAVARLGAHICDLLRITPFSFGHWELLRKDNIPSVNGLAKLLGRPPTDVVPKWQ
jgi:uncharacterized protein YbjT (DUF2867 family)